MIEVVWVHRGEPADPAEPMWPATVHDLRSYRLRYQHANKHLLMLIPRNGMAKFSAVWCPQAENNGRWQLVDILPDNVTVLT